ncbi:MAG: hypothetical protein Fur0037_14150 [Planctomycetota bacterium]
MRWNSWHGTCFPIGDRTAVTAIMVITQYGRVELDPMRVPQAASMRSGIESSFEGHLEAARQATGAEPRKDREEAVRPDEADAPKAPAPPPAAERDEAEDDTTATEAGEPATDAAERPADIPETNTRVEAERRIDAGKGSASSLSIPDRDAADPGPTAPDLPARGAALARQAPVAAARPVAARGPAETTRIPEKASVSSAESSKSERPRAPAAAYRTLNRQGVEMVEQARDSIFKQILLKLGDGGGEMRMRLEPPDLGELDVHLRVEKDGRLHLALGAERPEVHEMLVRHLGELEQTLRQSGFSIAEAQVRTRSEAGRRGTAAPRQGSAARQGEAADAESPPARGGYITAQGLDFWV